MQTKDFVVENGQMYYKKKPLHKQPLFSFGRPLLVPSSPSS
ncbi:hypothetical protein [Streptococcus suis]